MASQQSFAKPNIVERCFNQVFGFFTNLGMGQACNYQLIGVGRKSGQTFATPVYMLTVAGNSYLVAPRGETQWVHNMRVAQTVTLKRGREVTRYAADEIADASKAGLLKEYLTLHVATVKRFFSLSPDAPLTEFEAVAAQYPVFRITPAR